MSDYPEELAAAMRAAKEAQDRRTLSLRSRGWRDWQPYDRHQIYDWTLDRWELRNNARKVN